MFNVTEARTSSAPLPRLLHDKYIFILFKQLYFVISIIAALSVTHVIKFLSIQNSLCYFATVFASLSSPANSRHIENIILGIHTKPNPEVCIHAWLASKLLLTSDS